MLEVLISDLTQGSELERLISAELTASLTDGKLLGKSKEAIQKIVRRSFGRVGSDLNKILRASFTKANPLSLAPLSIHPLTNIVISRQTKKFPAKNRGYVGSGDVKGKLTPGSAWRTAINYFLEFEDGGNQGVTTGVEKPTGSDIYGSGTRKKRLLTAKGIKAFRNWQKGGALSFQGSPARQQRYLGAINVPMSAMSIARAPARDVVSTVEQRENPLERFRTALRERINK